jgi:hypothetical protein
MSITDLIWWWCDTGPVYHDEELFASEYVVCHGNSLESLFLFIILSQSQSQMQSHTHFHRKSQWHYLKVYSQRDDSTNTSKTQNSLAS